MLSNELGHILERIGKTVGTDYDTVSWIFARIYARHSCEKIRYIDKPNVNPRPAGGGGQILPPSRIFAIT